MQSAIYNSNTCIGYTIVLDMHDSYNTSMKIINGQYIVNIHCTWIYYLLLSLFFSPILILFIKNIYPVSIYIYIY